VSLDDARRRGRALADQAGEAQCRLPEPAAQLHLDQARGTARVLRDEVEHECRQAARALHRAADAAPRDPGWWRRIVAGADSWLREVVTRHARAVEVASFVLGVAAAAAAASVLVPVAVLLAGAGYAASLALVHYTEADESDLLLATAGVLTFDVGTTAAAVGAAAVRTGTASSLARADVAGRVGAVADDLGWKVTGYAGAAVVEGAVRDVVRRARERRHEQVLAPGPLVVPAPAPAPGR
jgi:hypothetical protein